ncbi:hypothetical protein V6N13_058691 [Hibiscus sabdariffa]|uniref:Uncharacterized protein n=1 Tax=Hibiscus sabdariffa TaxID=183260 RepID=A0ABR2GFW4_9ROSI
MEININNPNGPNFRYPKTTITQQRQIHDKKWGVHEEVRRQQGRRKRKELYQPPRFNNGSHDHESLDVERSKEETGVKLRARGEYRLSKGIWAL